MKIKKKAEISVILGVRGAGKSTLLRELLKKKSSKRVIVIDTLGEHSKGRKVVTSPVELVKAVKAKRFNIAVKFDDADIGFDWACRVAYAAENLVLVVEEVDWYVKAGYAPVPFGKLVRYGRHKSVEMICIARRPPDMWRNLTANADNLFMLRTTEPRDLKYIEEFIGKESSLQLKTLKDLEYLCYKMGVVSRGRTKF